MPIMSFGVMGLLDDFFNGVGRDPSMGRGKFFGTGNWTAHCNVQEECGTAVWM